MRSLVIALALLLGCSRGLAQGPVLAPGYKKLQFTPPAAGSYRLPPLGTATDGEIVDETGITRQLSTLLGDKLVLLGFIYTRCPDVNGCPLASHVMRQVQNALQEDKTLKSGVRLISLSFDPMYDSPQVMADYAGHFRRNRFDWEFLTTASEDDLQPILTGYGQWRRPVYTEDGTYSGTMSHILRVYLIDRQSRIHKVKLD